MKKIITICAATLMTATVFAQTPQKMSYQAVIRDGANALVANQTVGMQVSILQGSASGTAAYVETHSAATNTNGLISIEIGGGTVTLGSFAGIDWANGPYFIKTETDPAGGTNYTITGTSQLLSVPYAIFSGNGIRRISSIGDTLSFGNGQYLIIPGVSAANINGIGQFGITKHSCGVDFVHNSSLNYGNMTDQDGNIYKTILIGTQEWMAENLKVSHYRNGDLISIVTNDAIWSNLSSGAACWYNNDSATYQCPYGKLYNWYAVADVRQLCPTGWHAPDETEWSNLINYLDPNSNGGSNVNIVGGKMKTIGTYYWNSPNIGADNSTGFSGLPAGIRYIDGSFNNTGDMGSWWSTSEYNNTQAWLRCFLAYDNAHTNGGLPIKTNGFSVRCIKD